MAKRYRCINCGNEFIADKPACSTCQIDPATDPRAVGIIHSLATIHFDPPHPRIRHRGLGVRACDPSVSISRGRGTGEARVVNCDACKATLAFHEAVQKGALDGGFLEDDDEQVISTPAGVVLTGEKDCGCGGKKG